MTNVCFRTLDSIKSMLKIFRKRLRKSIYVMGSADNKKRNEISFLFILIGLDVIYPIDCCRELNCFHPWQSNLAWQCRH